MAVVEEEGDWDQSHPDAGNDSNNDAENCPIAETMIVVDAAVVDDDTVDAVALAVDDYCHSYCCCGIAVHDVVWHWVTIRIRDAPPFPSFSSSLEMLEKHLHS